MSEVVGATSLHPTRDVVDVFDDDAYLASEPACGQMTTDDHRLIVSLLTLAHSAADWMDTYVR